MLDSLFGGQLGTTAKFAIAFVLVLGLIGITALIIRRFGAGGMPSSGGGRGRQPRLAVLDSAVVDAKRRLVLIRRDNSEHLLLIGGPSDVVVETNIVRTSGPAPMPMPQTHGQPERRPAREARGAPPAQQQEPDYESSLVPEPPYDEPPAPAPYPGPRPQPAAYSPPPPLPPRSAAHPSAAAPAPQPSSAPQPAPQPASQTKLDPQYADMAQRLEAALRKPATAPAPKTPDTRPMPQAAQPRPAPTPQTRPMPASPAPAVSQPAPRPGPAPAGQPNPFDSLEAEMANLLGQDKKR